LQTAYSGQILAFAFSERATSVFFFFFLFFFEKVLLKKVNLVKIPV